MEYQKIGNLIDGASNQTSKYKTKNWVGIKMNQEERAMLIV